MNNFKIIANYKVKKTEQIVKAISRDIEKGVLKKDEKLPSINQFSKQYKVARDTIEKAYKELKRQGYIFSVSGSGYFVEKSKKTELRILLVFNKLSSFKKNIYDSFLQALGKRARVDLQIHHYDPCLLKEILENNMGKYHYYVIMPHFYLNVKISKCKEILESIPEDELVILDKRVPGLKSNCIEVYQDFKMDIYTALSSAINLLKKYSRINLLIDPRENHPREIIFGITQFCKEHNKILTIASPDCLSYIQEKTVYITTTEDDLALVIKEIRISGFRLGKDVGVISFNETVLKELLGITVITTDFKMMGKTAAECILNKRVEKVSNPFCMIRRRSL